MELEFPIHHVIVVGFHHKKGCQIEYAYPPFSVDIEKTAWKHLPTLAMPDGAHNYSNDTVYFHLPSLTKQGETVFGVACYRQVEAEKVKNKGEDVTRSTIQKSVCVLSKYPLYGHVQVKMSLITAAYFREGDFAQVSILEEAYHNLNASLSPHLLSTPEAFVGLSPRDLIFTFRHDVLLLLKLLLLEKRILFRGSSVGPLCSALLALVSLLPLTLEFGMKESACVRLKKSLSIIPQFSSTSQDEGQEKMDVEKPVPEDRSNSNSACLIQGSVAVRGHDAVDEAYSKPPSIKSPVSEVGSDFGSEKGGEETPDFVTAVQMAPEDAGLPLTLFTRGYLCHPYLSLHYMDLLSDAGVRGFIVGATNILFKQKRDLVDVVVEMQDGMIEVYDPVIRKVASLTTEDLRFADNLVRIVTQDGSRGEDNFMDGVGWEGGDEWIRAQFKYYLMCLMRTSLTEDGNRNRDRFGTAFVPAWQNTLHWKTWNKFVTSEERETPGIYLLSPGHPCSGQLGVNDMKLRLAHTIQKSESGRKLNQAVGKAVVSTGKAVGGALSQAKGAFSSWWSSVATGVEIGSEDTTETTKDNEQDIGTSVDGEGTSKRPQGQTTWFTT